MSTMHAMPRRRRTRRRAAAAMLAAVVLVTGACGGGNDDDGKGAVSAADAGTSQAALKGIVQTDGAPSKPTGTLRIGHWLETLSMDPVMVTTHQGYLLMPVYDTLFNIDADFQPQPNLVTKWDQPDPLTYRLTLRDDVTFQDGSKFDAETVKLNFERAKAMVESPNANMYEPIASVKVESPTVAVVKLNEPYPDFYYNMSTIAGAMVSPKAIKAKTDLTRETAGSGGWIWDKAAHVEGSKHVYHANPDYWNPDAVKIKNIDISIMGEDTARFNAFSTGQIDLLANVPSAQQDSLPADSVLLSDFTVTDSFVIMDRAGKLVPAFADPDVRKAVGLLIDRDGYNQAALSGTGDPTVGGFAAPSTQWYDSSLDEERLDVEEARKLLADAGYPDGFSFELASTSVTRPQSEAIAQMLAAGGITAKIVDVQTAEYTASLRKGEFPAAYLVPTSVDIDQWWRRTVSNKGPLNPFGLDDLADLEKQYAESAAVPDPADRVETMSQLQAQTLERGVAFPLAQKPRTAAVSANVKATQMPVFAPEDWGPRPQYLWIAK